MRSAHFSEEHELLRDQVRRFIDEVVRPSGEAWEEAGEIPRAVLRRMGALGFLGMRYPVEYGGSGADAMASAILAEELARSSFGGFTVTVLVHTDMASPHLAGAGNAEQKARYLPGIVSGEILTAVAVTEPDAGSDVAAMRTTARRDGDHWVLDGSKMFITNGVSADVVFVAAKTDPKAKGSRGISMFIVERSTAGFSVGRKLKKQGWRSSDTAELVFEACRVPAANLLGDENRGFYSIMRNFQNERLVLSGMAVGEATEALRLTREYVKTRKAFGATLWDKQAIRQRLSMLEAKVEAARQLYYHTAWQMSRDIDSVREVSMLKAYSAELVNEVMYDCQQFHGGFGYIQESTIERMVRDARVLSIGGGATEVMLEEVAKRSDERRD
ncbi:MAG TPA: acyl-CoA dehydrogenase family protein [Candidatus Binatia bacterium]|nr:acyl-CoA dehydrogenase family protein [Candidatus Binatia bacterium]